MLSPEEKMKQAELMAAQILNESEFVKFEHGTVEEAEAIVQTEESKNTAAAATRALLDKGMTADELQEMNEIAEMAAQIIAKRLQR